MQVNDIIKDFYSFDEKTFVFTGKKAVIKEGDKWNIPSDCTDVAPPEATGVFVPIWNPETREWSLIEDYRPYTDNTGHKVVRKKLWLKTAKYGDSNAVITELGDYDHDLYTEQEPIEPTPYERFVESVSKFETRKEKVGYCFSSLLWRLEGKAFSSIPVVDIDGIAYTVDGANRKYQEQVGDDDEKAVLIKARWKEAKDYIRTIDFENL